MRRLRQGITGLIGLYLIAVGLLFAFQRELIYSPHAIDELPRSRFATLDNVEEIAVDTADGIELKAWYSPAPDGRPTVVLLPGKSSSLQGDANRIERFEAARMGVLLLAYRGYSGNPGTPSEAGLYSDARAALNWLGQHGVKSSSVIVYGVSLGSGVAVRMAVERELGAVVLEAPYTSIADVAARRFPFVPVHRLLKDRFDSLSDIHRVSEPLLVMHGDGDTVIPQALGRHLYLAANYPKQGLWPHDVGHDDIFDSGGFDAAVEFIEQIVNAPS